MLWPRDIDDGAFLRQDFSDSLGNEIGPGHKMVEYAYIVDFASVLFIYLSVRNMGEVGGKSANVLSES
jgi:hypothetical protein